MPQAPFPAERLGRAPEATVEVREPSPSDSDESDAEGLPPVLALRCAACSAELSTRGMQVFLVADNSSLFSTDIPSDAIEEGGAHPITTCECAARDVLCRFCKTVVGYHVTRPCQLCSAAEHNGHFWLFCEESIAFEERGILWDALPYNGQPEDDRRAPAATVEEEAAGMATGEDDEAACAVCTSAPMWRPHRFPCGHAFCFGCASREVDMRGCCPLDRLPATRESLVPCEPAG